MSVVPPHVRYSEHSVHEEAKCKRRIVQVSSLASIKCCIDLAL